MRHGVSSLIHNPEKDPERPGCYFCNDYLAPGDTMSDRTLDQQCTVTRPGLSYVSSGYAVELMVNIISHPLGAYAPPETDGNSQKMNPDADMGLVPAHIRGSVGHFEAKVMESSAFSSCLACGKGVSNSTRKTLKSL